MKKKRERIVRQGDVVRVVSTAAQVPLDFNANQRLLHGAFDLSQDFPLQPFRSSATNSGLSLSRRFRAIAGDQELTGYTAGVPSPAERQGMRAQLSSKGSRESVVIQEEKSILKKKAQGPIVDAGKGKLADVKFTGATASAAKKGASRKFTSSREETWKRLT